MPRALIVVFDALRPEFVTPELMPRLTEFAAAGARYLESRSTFPTETRVNQSAVTTGCLPHRHGVVANKFVAEDLLPGAMVNTGDDAALVEALAEGPVLCVPNLAERLAGHGRSFASLSAGTPGGGRLINHSAERLGSTRFAMRAPEACCPSTLHQDLCALAGPLPDSTPPAAAWIDWAVTAYLDGIEARQAPDVGLLWLCEPDESFHWHGIGGPEALQIIRHVDTAFGRILDRLAPAIASGEMHVVAMSDHGQLSLTGPRLDLAEKLTEAGFRTSRSGLGKDADCALSLANGGGIWVREHDAATIRRLATWLQQQPWCGPVFTADGVAETLPLAAVGLDHRRAPDVALVLRASDAPNAHGIPGTSVHDAPYPTGGGCHGGLSQWELHNVLTIGGAGIRAGSELTLPAGNIDVLPTVLHLLGLPVPEDIDGRVLAEAFHDGPEVSDVSWEPAEISASSGSLAWRQVGPHRYLDRAWKA